MHISKSLPWDAKYVKMRTCVNVIGDFNEGEDFTKIEFRQWVAIIFFYVVVTHLSLHTIAKWKQGMSHLYIQKYDNWLTKA